MGKEGGWLEEDTSPGERDRFRGSLLRACVKIKEPPAPNKVRPSQIHFDWEKSAITLRGEKRHRVGVPEVLAH